MTKKHCISDFLILVSIVIFCDFLPFTKGSVETEIQTNQLSIKFRYTDLKFWSNNVMTRLKTSVSEYANVYCTQNTSQCGMSLFREFTASDVVIEPRYPQQTGKSSVMLLHTELPEGTGRFTDLVLRKNAFKSLVMNNRDDLRLKLRNSADKLLPHSWTFTVMEVDGVSVVPPNDETLNYIFIPTLCAIIGFLVLIVSVFEYQSRMNKKRNFELVMREILKTRETQKSQRESAVQQTINGNPEGVKEESGN